MRLLLLQFPPRSPFPVSARPPSRSPLPRAAPRRSSFTTAFLHLYTSPRIQRSRLRSSSQSFSLPTIVSLPRNHCALVHLYTSRRDGTERNDRENNAVVVAAAAGHQQRSAADGPSLPSTPPPTLSRHCARSLPDLRVTGGPHRARLCETRSSHRSHLSPAVRLALPAWTRDECESTGNET